MLKSLRIKNFKSQKDTELSFSKWINVIIGDPLSGKTNILRALYLLFSYRPLGFDYHSHFSEEPTTEVEAEFTDPNGKIQLVKDANTAVYWVNGRKFTGIRTSVPDEAVELINMNNLNIGKQLAEQFLICASPGEAARVINQITKLENVDKWTSSLTSKILQENREIKILEAQKLEAGSIIKKFDNLPQVIASLTEAQALADREKEVLQTLVHFNVALAELEEIDESLHSKKALLKLEGIVGEASQIMETMTAHEACLTDISRIEEIDEAITENTRFLRAEEVVLPALEVINQIETFIIKIHNAQNLEYEITNLESEISLGETELTEIKNLLQKFLREDCEGRCPLCFSKTSKVTPEHVMELFG
jgi:DNA repair ATPase RecN